LPTPAQESGVPIIVGGTTDAAIRRVVERGDGWYMIHKDLDDFRANVDKLRRECERRGRDSNEIELTAYWNHNREGMEGFEVYAEHGVSRLLVNLAALRMGDAEEAAEQFASEVLARL
jgi:alkanesulfonate monooxygenase SsuD/methylene tetrahydromethanopterin reductase-like flavin-dependent oxidoreductase (luciferase family)